MGRKFSTSDVKIMEPPGGGSKKRFKTADVKLAPKEEGPSQLESGLRGTLQGGSMGYSDEGEGVARALYGKIIKGDKRPFGDVYSEARDEARAANKKAQEANPATYLGGEVAGGLGTALAMPASGAPLLARALAQGALTAHGYSEGATPEERLKDMAGGSVTGAMGYGVGKGVEKVAAPVVGSVLGPSTKAIRDYITNKPAVMTARPFEELGEAAQQAVGKLKQRGVQGSRAAVDLIPEEGMVSAQGIQKEFQPLISQFEGAGGFGPGAKSAKRTIEGLRDDFFSVLEPDQKVAGPAMNANLRDLKTILKRLDSETTIAKNKGEFSTPENLAKLQLRQKIDSLLKGEVPAYADAMKEVAEDFRKLELAKQFGAKGTINDVVGGRIKKAAQGKAHQEEALEALDPNLLKEARARLTREEFDKDMTRGSKGVNLGALVGGGALGAGSEFFGSQETSASSLGQAALVGGIVGALRDRYGGAMARKILDGAIMTGKLPLLQAAYNKGPEALAMTSYLLKKQLTGEE